MVLKHGVQDPYLCLLDANLGVGHQTLVLFKGTEKPLFYSMILRVRLCNANFPSYNPLIFKKLYLRQVHP